LPRPGHPSGDEAGMAAALGLHYRRLTSPEMTVMAAHCDTAPVLARAFDDWIAAVHSAGLQRDYVDALIDARVRAAVIRKRCAPVADGPRPRTLAAERVRRR